MTTGPKPGTLKAGMFDAFRLARERGSLRGSFDAAASERLDDWLAPGEAPIAWSIAGTTDARGRPALAIELDGAVPLACQRCLAPIAVAGARSGRSRCWRRARPKATRWTRAATTKCWWPTAPLDAVALVEDELLLTLPYAPTHADGECAAPE